ncbi:NUDIX hydrolase [Allorhizobium sp. BGMRC 0089]|uniref:NUDIX hydrolase n=1 Tax=Allorhizobium sonneratiae TaxID=2934936 RepID=UPI002033B1BF|nr:NUDIX hydrolase [Allorhizobium sonneratiae]MCM2293848.1 NUDIX hydrolase [Allorhizobium sonneratiae]
MIKADLQTASREAAQQQFGAICYRSCDTGKACDTGKDGVEVLLITSRDTGRWVIPKGWPMGNKKSHAVAQREAYEEAGAKGHVSKKSTGSYVYDKRLKDGSSVVCEVQVFLLQVHDMLGDYPEKGARSLAWVTCDEAARRVQEPDLKRLFLHLSANPPKIRPPKLPISADD